MIKKIIFDLDGTLWQTRDSYIYAYKKLCQKYGQTPKNGFEDVLNYMGVKIDSLLRDLFPEIVDQTLIIREALNYSIEYILENPKDTCFENVYQVLKTLNDKFEIYIISNCLKEYVETFLSISGTKDFVKGFYTIEAGEKYEHLFNITNGFSEKAVFVGDDIEDYNQINDHKQVSFVYAKYGYKSCDTYDYSINCLLDLIGVISLIIKKERILINYDHEVLSHNDTNFTLIKKPNDVFYFGFLNIHNLDDLQIVIDKAKKITKGCTLIGPIDGNTFYKYRFAIDNFDWILYPDAYTNKAVYELFIKNGFTIKQKYSSTLANVNERLYLRSKRSTIPNDYKFVLIEGKDCYKYLDELYEIGIDAFRQADFYEEISKEDFIDLYLENINLCSPDLLLVYYKGEPIAFHFSYEDIEKRFYVSKTVGIKKKFQFQTCMFKMIDFFYSLVIERGYDKVLHHFMNDRTKTLQLMYKGYEIKKKNFALLEYKNE